MKFHEHTSFQKIYAERFNQPKCLSLSFDEFADVFERLADPNNKEDCIAMSFLQDEIIWRKNRRPFYNAYPGVCECLKNTKLEFTFKQLGLEMPPTLICFAEGHEPIANGEKVKSCMVMFKIGIYDLHKKKHFDLAGFHLVYACKSGTSGVLSAFTEEKISDFANDSDRHLISLCIGLAMLAKDERFAEPILLKRDEGRQLNEEQKKAAIERAIRNGRNGIAIGKDIEVSPHMRRPHFAVRWTGKGKAVPRLTPIKGSLVSRSKLYPIPTGYLDDVEGQESN